MKTDDLNLTIEELDMLCQLYLDCKLSVLEEKELEYILCTTSLTSPSIDEVRGLMNVQLLPRQNKAAGQKRFWKRKYMFGVAASIAVILSLALYFTTFRTSDLNNGNSNAYIAAYSHGKHLSDIEAVESMNLAMAKADSLIRYATLDERDYLLKANNIINETLNN